MEHPLRKTFGWEYEDFCKQYLKDSAEKRWLTRQDWCWRLLNRLLINGIEPSTIYHMQAVFVHQFEGKSGVPYDKLRIEANLHTRVNEVILRHKYSLEDWNVRATCSKGACPHGLTVHDSTYPIDPDNLNPAGLATDKCTHDRCFCFYSVLTKRDKAGRLDLKKQK